MKHDLILGHGTTIVDVSGGLVTPIGGTAILKVDAPMLRNGNAPYHPELQYLGLLQELLRPHPLLRAAAGEERERREGGDEPHDHRDPNRLGASDAVSPAW